MRNLEGLKKGWGWNKGTKGLSKANSGSFKKGKTAYNKKTPISRNCVQCAKLFTTKPSLARVNSCSRNCAMKYRFRDGGINKGKTLSMEWREALRGPREHTRGTSNHRWLSDRNLLKKSEKKHLDYTYRIWMRAVKDRDNWRCRIFNKDCRGRLEAHHILNWVEYPELRYDLTNGISLCQGHHPRGRSEEKRLEAEFQQLVSASKITL